MPGESSILVKKVSTFDRDLEFIKGLHKQSVLSTLVPSNGDLVSTLRSQFISAATLNSSRTTSTISKSNISFTKSNFNIELFETSLTAPKSDTSLITWLTSGICGLGEAIVSGMKSGVELAIQSKSEMAFGDGVFFYSAENYGSEGTQKAPVIVAAAYTAGVTIENQR